MNIDWFTFVAQIVNFLILVALLYRFLYGPIVRAMREREEQLARRWDDAQRKQTEADEQIQQFHRKNRELEDQREELLREARREAREERDRLTSDARDDVQQKRDEWIRGLNHEQQAVLEELRQQSGELSVAIARRVLQELADAELESQMTHSLLNKMTHLDERQRQEIAGHLADGEGDVLVRSVFEIPAREREEFREVVKSLFAYEDRIDFERADDLICGVELDAGGYTFGWSVRDLLRGLSLDIQERMKTKP